MCVKNTLNLTEPKIFEGGDPPHAPSPVRPQCFMRYAFFIFSPTNGECDAAAALGALTSSQALHRYSPGEVCLPVHQQAMPYHHHHSQLTSHMANVR